MTGSHEETHQFNGISVCLISLPGRAAGRPAPHRTGGLWAQFCWFCWWFWFWAAPLVPGRRAEDRVDLVGGVTLWGGRLLEEQLLRGRGHTALGGVTGYILSVTLTSDPQTSPCVTSDISHPEVSQLHRK